VVRSTLERARQTWGKYTEDFATALHVAIENAQFDSLQLKDDADPNTREGLDRIPLHYSTTVDAACLLLAYGADLNSRNIGGRTPLHEASAR
jgi:ankyrin repeat protein